MSDKTKVWLLAGLAGALAIGVIWQLISRKDEFFPGSETVANVQPPGNSESKRVTSAGHSGNPTNRSPATKTPATTPPLSPYTGAESSADSPLAKPNAGIEGNSTSAPAQRKTVLKSAPPTATQPRRPEVGALSSPTKGGTAPAPYAPVPAPSKAGAASSATTPKVDPSQTPPLPGPEPLTAEVMVQNAQTAMAHGNYISPPENSALYWARRARRMKPQNQPAIQIEETILFEVTQLIQADRKAARYDSALMRLDMMQKLYPNRPELTQLQSTIQQEQSRRQGTIPH